MTQWTQPRRWRDVIGVLVLVTAGGAGCSTSAQSPGTVDQAQSVVDPNAVLGFETAAGWIADDSHLATTTMRTQGQFALIVDRGDDGEGDVQLRSVPIASTATALAGLGDPASELAIDVHLPVATPRPGSDRDDDPHVARLELTLNCPSRRLHEAHLRPVLLRGVRPGAWGTVKLPITDEVRQALGGATYDDLRIRVQLHDRGERASHFIFDNLRVHSSSTPPAGAGQQVDLSAFLAYAPPSSTPAVASFPVGGLQVPQSLHVKLGSAGTGSATLAISNGGTVVATCTYAGATTAYNLASCTGGYQAGDLVAADAVTLTLGSGDATAGTTKVRAQLALNPVGDVLGANVIPPMPTYWGNGGADTSQILDVYTAALTATPPTEHVWVRTPTPDYARRESDFHPVDTSHGPPPPNDPVFHQAGHANPGGDFDAYWALDGSLEASSQNCQAGSTTCHNTAHFDADASAHVVLFGGNNTIAEVSLSVDTDTGIVQANGYQSPNARGCLNWYLFGSQMPMPGSGCVDPSVGFNLNLGVPQQTFNLPPITFWVFSITVGVYADAGVTAMGSLSPEGFGLNITPHADFGAHLEGDIGIAGIIEGGLDARVDLLSFTMPFNAHADWTISTDPAACSANVQFGASGNITLNSGGGEVDLEASFGPCPFCLSASQKLFSWAPLFSTTFNIFTVATNVASFGLPPSLCDSTPLNVSASAPNAGNPFTAGQQVQLGGSGTRPGSLGSPTPTFIDCQYFTWTQSSNPDDAGLFPQSPCNPLMTFPTSGPRTLTLVATDQYGETGQDTVTFTVQPAPQALTAIITQPTNGTLRTIGQVLNLVGACTDLGRACPASTLYTWYITDPNGVVTPIFGLQDTTFSPTVAGTYTIQLIVQPGVGSATSTITVRYNSLT